MAFLLVTLSERRRRWRVSASLACGVAVGLVAVSRIYLDMHWLSDVIGGFTLGTAYLLIALCTAQTTFADNRVGPDDQVGGRATPSRVVAVAERVEALPST
jgi:membrane-associated phospholipid phosphatase